MDRDRDRDREVEKLSGMLKRLMSVISLGEVFVVIVFVIVLAVISMTDEDEEYSPSNEVLLLGESSQWPYESNESLEVNIHSANDQWPYEIEVQWWPEEEKSLPFERFSVLGVVGRASISITEPTLKTSVAINTQYFHVPNESLTTPQENSIEIYLSDLPQPLFRNMEVKDLYSWDTPIIIEDVDFDGVLELIVINHGQGQRMGHSFEVFDLEVLNDELIATLKDQPPLSQLDSKTKFDDQKKTITIYSSGGSCSSRYDSYSMSEVKPKPLQSIQYDYDESGCYKYTYAYKKTFMGLSKVLLMKEQIE